MQEPKPDTTPTPAPEPKPKKPYTTPKLKHLGSIRTLTLGTSTGSADRSGMGKPSVM